MTSVVDASSADLERRARASRTAPVEPVAAEGDTEKIAAWREAMSTRHPWSAIGVPDRDPGVESWNSPAGDRPSAASPGHGT